MKQLATGLLLLLALAAPSRANVAIVRPPGNVGTNAINIYNAFFGIQAIAERLGASPIVVDWQAATTDGLRDGKIYWGRSLKGGGLSTHSTDVAAFAIPWQADFYPATFGFSPDSATLAAKWPGKPMLLLGPCGSGSFANQGGGTPDTTGIAAVLPYNTYRDRYRVQLNGSREVWVNQNTQPMVSNAGSRGPGIWRPVISAAVATGTADQNTETCASCDDPAGDLATAQTDSVLLAARYRSSKDRAPIVIASHSASSSLIGASIIAAALAMADSASGGAVFDQLSSRGPLKLGIYLQGGFATGRYSQNHGVFCAADSCDTLNLQAISDSLKALRYYTSDGYVPVPMTLGVDPDSAKRLTYQRRIFDRVGSLHFAIESRSGAEGTNVVVGNTHKYRVLDVFGASRARNASNPSATCATNDSDLVCTIKAAYAVLDSLWPGRVDHGVQNYDDDWLPIGVTYQDATQLDNIICSLYRGGVRAVVVSPDRQNANISLTGASGDALGYHPTADYFGVAADCSRGWTHRIRVLRSRGITNWGTQGGLTYKVIHGVTGELLDGLLMGMWYVTPTANTSNAFYRDQPSPHMFQTDINVLSVPVSTLGGSGQGTLAHRPGWYQLKWLVNQISAINKLAGRTVIRFAYLEDI